VRQRTAWKDTCSGRYHLVPADGGHNAGPLARIGTHQQRLDPVPATAHLGHVRIRLQRLKAWPEVPARPNRLGEGLAPDLTRAGACTGQSQRPFGGRPGSHRTSNSKKPRLFAGLSDLSDCLGKVNGAQERTRTSTTLRSLAPEASASTNSATWARVLSCATGATLKDPACQVALSARRPAAAKTWEKRVG
jgi:hypothetical protein